MREFTQKDALKTLREFLLREMELHKYTLFEMAIKCDISQRQFCNILYGNNPDIKLSTFIKICENIKIPYDYIFEYTGDYEDKKIDLILSKFAITNGSVKYGLYRVGNNCH